MSVLTLPAQPGQDAPERPVPWRGMVWVTLRQQRATLIAVPAVLAAVAVFLVIFGLKVHHDYAALVNCPLDQGQQSNACAKAFSHFNSTDWPLGNTCSILMSLAPVLIGAFAGAPLLARELETGTYRFAWTQGMVRERQAIAKLVLLGVTIVVLVGAFGELFSWFFQPFLYTGADEPADGGGLRHQRDRVPRLRARLVRDRRVPRHAAAPGHPRAGRHPRRLPRDPARRLGRAQVLPGGGGHRQQQDLQPVRDAQRARLPVDPEQLGHRPGRQAGQPVRRQPDPQWPPGASVPPGYTEWNRWIPLSHYWPMQFIEAGWLLVLAVALMAGTVWLVRRRAA